MGHQRDITFISTCSLCVQGVFINAHIIFVFCNCPFMFCPSLYPFENRIQFQASIILISLSTGWLKHSNCLVSFAPFRGSFHLPLPSRSPHTLSGFRHIYYSGLKNNMYITTVYLSVFSYSYSSSEENNRQNLFDVCLFCDPLDCAILPP